MRNEWKLLELIHYLFHNKQLPIYNYRNTTRSWANVWDRCTLRYSHKQAGTQLWNISQKHSKHNCNISASWLKIYNRTYRNSYKFMLSFITIALCMVTSVWIILVLRLMAKLRSWIFVVFNILLLRKGLPKITVILEIWFASFWREIKYSQLNFKFLMIHKVTGRNYFQYGTL